MTNTNNKYSNTRSKGSKSEEIAVRFLEDKGYVILERNYHCSKKEIDIIARKDNTISFIEVKGKSKKAIFNPEYLITSKKQKSIFQVANYYLEKNKLLDFNFSFDVVIVNYTDDGILIDHLENSLQFI